LVRSLPLDGVFVDGAFGRWWCRMLSLTVFLSFVAATTVLAITPGPNMSLIIANTLSGGLRSGLLTLAGALTGNTILVAAAAVGMSSLMVFMHEWFDLFRGLGAAYLLFLGARQLWQFARRDPSGVTLPIASARSIFAQGLAVSLSNPKVLLFLGAFLPQFVDNTRDPLPQLWTLAVLFVLVLAITDAAYTLFLARARHAFSLGKLQLMNGFAGALLVAGGLMLLAVRRPS
jgi:homoserine/homoserine lactone efflux protein